MFIDLDHFKSLNDTLGHDIGDLLLVHVAERLGACVREGDTVARRGSDEFAIILEDLSNETHEAATQARQVAEKILNALRQPCTIDGYERLITASIGVTLFSDHQRTAAELMKCADLAMHQAKAAGHNTLRFFEPEMQTVVTARANLENALRSAIARKEFTLHFQPQVHRDGRLIGAEALVRWQHPRHGLMLPDEFMPLAEQTGLNLPLGLWVLESACAQLAMWATDPKSAKLCVAVNVSAQQFRHANFIDQVLSILARSGANPATLTLELTESVLQDDVDDTIEKMHALKRRGVRFSLDNFGIGYSCLTYLKRLPLSQLKIDRSFIHNLLTTPGNAAIAKMIITLARDMDLEVIAEGVETMAQHDFLADHGCTDYQGPLFSQPVPLHVFEKLYLSGIQ